MNAEILSVGTELLLGEIYNLDAQIISQGLSELGINVYYHTVVGDNPDRLKSAIEIARSRADIIITTGGLGPTYDDLTKETLAQAFGKELELHGPSLEKMRGLFAKNKLKMTKNNDKQAYLPVGSTVLENDMGTAPGCAFEAYGKHVIMLPGPPKECSNMFREKAMPYLMKLSGGVIFSKSVRLFGIGESEMEEKILDLIKNMTNPTIAPYAKPNECLLRVTAKAETEEKARVMVEPAIESVSKILGEFIYGIDVESLEEVVVPMLLKKGLSISAAESCTGGLLAKRITDIPGSSGCFKGGICAYSNEIKTGVLGVDAGLIEKCGAVSEEVAKTMAQKVREKFSSDIGVGITGVAGPGGGTEEKPVGLVYVAVETKNGVKTRKLQKIFGGREGIRNMAASNALDIIRREIQNF